MYTNGFTEHERALRAVNQAAINLEALKSGNAADQTRERLVESAPADNHEGSAQQRDSPEPRDTLMQHDSGNEDEHNDTVSGLNRRDTEPRID